MPPTGTDGGIQVARTLRETDPQIGVVVLSQFAETSYVLELRESGSAGRARSPRARSPRGRAYGKHPTVVGM
jgi:DNA-binding NarL/FixJ family response regulator